MPIISRVMIVDDEPAARDTLEMVLSVEGYDLVVVENGPDALKTAAAEPPDLILLDVMMPGMDGFEVCRRLRADPVLTQVPVIIVTALEDRESRLRGIRAGADDFITKPFDTVELRARVRTITRLNRYRRLLAEQDRFQWVVQEAQEGYVIVDRLDHIRYLNPQARRYLNLAPQESLLANRQTPTEAFLTLARVRYQLYPEEAWNDWPATAVEMSPRYLVRPETSQAPALWLHAEVMVSPDTAEDIYVLRLQDVSKQMVSQRGLDGFHHLIVHKMGTPLTHICFSLDLLEMATSKYQDAELQENMAVAWESYRRLEDDFTKVRHYLNAANRVSGPEGFALAKLTETVHRICRDLEIQEAHVSIAPDIAAMEFSMTSWTMECILTELLTNAQKHHPTKAPLVEIEAVPIDGGRVRLTSMDDGQTLPAEQIARIWTPYYQVEKNLTGEVPGMGLGLPTIAAMVWSVGGQCRLYNRTRSPGVVVEVEVPARESRAIRHSDAAAPMIQEDDS